MELIGHGVDTPRKLLKEIGNRLSVLGMGDLELWYRLRNMSEQPHALIKIPGKKTTPSFENGNLALTEIGEEVVSGLKDWIKVKGIDEWYGGLGLNGDLVWRWDSQRKQLIYME